MLVFYFLIALFRLYRIYIIVIPNPTQHPSLVVMHFAIFLSFLTGAVNFILSHTTARSHPSLSLFFLHLTSQKHSSFLPSAHTLLPPYKSLLPFPSLQTAASRGKGHRHCFNPRHNSPLLTTPCTLNPTECSPRLTPLTSPAPCQ